MTVPGSATDAPLISRDSGFVDLHSHSTASDGIRAPREVVDTAVRAGLLAIALTDHDTIDGVPEAVQTGEQHGIRVIAGCELSAHDGPKEVHLLALHITKPEAIQSQLTLFREQRDNRARMMVEKLVAKGMNISFDDVLRESNGGVIGRPHVARALLQHGYVSDLRSAFEKYLATGRPGYVEKPRLAVSDAINIAHDAGALAIWAHPGRDGTRDRLVAMQQVGLDGVEVLHPSHTPADVQRLSDLTNVLSLLPSGGSDWHGAAEGYRVLGNMRVPLAWLERQDAYRCRTIAASHNKASHQWAPAESPPGGAR